MEFWQKNRFRLCQKVHDICHSLGFHSDYNFYYFRFVHESKKKSHWKILGNGNIYFAPTTFIDAILVLVRYSIERSQVYRKKRQPFYENSHFLLKTSIGLTATAYPTALFVTLVFWTFLFNYNETFHFGMGSWINLTVHLFQVCIYTLNCMYVGKNWVGCLEKCV